jgi:hypothetical protein
MQTGEYTMDNFKVIYRSPGHWDIYDSNRRIFAIRGGPGKYYIRDERHKEIPACYFKTVGACMAWVCDELMHEVIVVEGQQPTTIAAWNIAD